MKVCKRFLDALGSHAVTAQYMAVHELLCPDCSKKPVVEQPAADADVDVMVGLMRKQILQAISLKALQVPFPEGLSDGERNAITDHMIAVKEAIESFRTTDFIGHGRHS